MKKYMEMKEEFITMTEKEYNDFYKEWKKIVESPESTEEDIKKVNYIMDRVVFED